MRWEKSVLNNLFRIGGFWLIGVQTNKSDWIWISLSKHIRKKFPSHHCFRAQRIYYIIIDVCSYQYGAEKILSLSNIQQNVSHTAITAVYPYIHTLIKSMLTTSCTLATRAVESEVPTPGNFDYPTPGRLRPSAVLVT